MLMLCLLQELKDKLCRQQEELKQLLKDARNSPGLLYDGAIIIHLYSLVPLCLVACMLQYSDSPPKLYHSTPAKVSNRNALGVGLTLLAPLFSFRKGKFIFIVQLFPLSDHACVHFILAARLEKIIHECSHAPLYCAWLLLLTVTGNGVYIHTFYCQAS